MKNLALRIEKEFLPYVNKPGRYTGNEYNVISKELNSVELRVALAFPEIYELGMSYVGYDILYHILNSQPDIWAERVYAPWIDAEEVLRRKQIPLFSLESRTSLVEFDWIGFTLQYELTYSTFLNMLDLAGIPLRAEERHEKWPLIIGGGPAVYNPEPVADFFDVFLIGDGEEAVLEICEAVKKSKKEKLSKGDCLKVLSQVQGVYIPSFYRVFSNSFGEFQEIQANSIDLPKLIKKRILPELQTKNYPLKPLVPLIEVTHDRLSLEIMRGCTEGCRFCNAGMIYRPLRQRPVDDIVNMTQQAIHSTGFKEVSLLSLNSSDYTDLNWLMAKEKMLLSEDKISFTFPSLRLDGLTPEMVDFVQTFKKSGFTFAPEAGSQRLRNVINKNIREEHILETLQLILRNGWQLVKFYFMIGLPTEKEQDLQAIIDLIHKCRDMAKGYRDVRFNISISPFSPKPHTPFQWEKQDDPEELERKSRLIRNQLMGDDINVTWRDGYLSSLETVFTRGGRELGDILEEAWRNGSKFDGWNEGFNWYIWEEAFAKFKIDWRKYLRPISMSVPLPWDHIDMGISKSFLKKEKFRAYEGKLSQDCKDYICLECGLHRKEFEQLVNCYKKEPSTAKGEKYTTSFDSNSACESTPTIYYGRSAKKRQVTSQSVKKKIRLRYSKTGLSRFISHLDVARLFDRAARRAQISLVYSQGFTPRPRMAFGPPLVLGIASIAEYVDVEAEIGYEHDIQMKLNQVLPEGIRILMQKIIYAKVPSLASIINRATYETFLEDFELSYDWITEWLSQEEIIVERIVKEDVKKFEIKPFICNIKLRENILCVTLDAKGDRMAKITEILDSLFGMRNVDYRLFFTQRTGQYIVNGDEVCDPFAVI
jgi:radical SAM family uncharacterized protein/radical SAM-linked protein